MTAQIHEVLILNGETISMMTCPLLPATHPRVIAVNDEEARKSRFPIFSTACWRGYVATWAVKDGLFYLAAIEGHYTLSGTEPLLADWFSGVLLVPRGRLLQYVHMGFESVYEEELHIEIKQGVVVNSRVVDNRSKQKNDVSIPPGFADNPLQPDASKN
jgi:hypothetical protein